MDGQFVTIVVSDPWEFRDENEGRIAFVARIVGNANGKWLIRFKRPIFHEGAAWNYAIPTARLVGQGSFDEPGANESANILLVSDAQAADQNYLSSFNSKTKPNTPWVIGSMKMGVVEPIPEGRDYYTEPKWMSTKRAR